MTVDTAVSVVTIMTREELWRLTETFMSQPTPVHLQRTPTRILLECVLNALRDERCERMLQAVARVTGVEICGGDR